MRKINILLLVILSVLLHSCKDGTKDTSKGSTKANSSISGGFDSVPNEMMKNLWDNCTGIDYLFHKLPFSMSQTDKASIQTNLSYIDRAPQTSIPSNCKPIGRNFFQVNGDIVMEADLYYSEGCQFFVFVENEKPIYANKMTDAGIQFFTNMIQQAMNAAQQQ